MLKKEFEERIGRSVSEEEYKTIEFLYINSSLDKDAFAIEWQRIGNNPLLLSLAHSLDVNLSHSKYLTDEVCELTHKLSDAVLHMLTVANSPACLSPSSDDLLLKSEQLIGKLEVVKLKVSSNLLLTDSDLDFIKTHL